MHTQYFLFFEKKKFEEKTAKCAGCGAHDIAEQLTPEV